MIPARTRLRGVDIPRDDGLADASEGPREVRDALQGLADVRLNALASIVPKMRVELRCESLDPAEPMRFPTRSG